MRVPLTYGAWNSLSKIKAAVPTSGTIMIMTRISRLVA